MSKSRPARLPTRLSAEDWIAAARQVIAAEGVAAVAVEPLAQHLGVTKGSFYWHFPNRGALLQATLEHWEREYTEAVNAELDQIADPRERFRQLMMQALSVDRPAGDRSAPAFLLGNAFLLAVADASEDPLVKPIFQRVTTSRVDFLVQCFRDLGLPPEEARFRALLFYAAYLGTLRLARETPSCLPVGEAAAAYREYFLSTLVPG